MKCCENLGKYKIIYDIGTGSEEWIICDYHFKLNESFRKHIKQLDFIDPEDAKKIKMPETPYYTKKEVDELIKKFKEQK